MLELTESPLFVAAARQVAEASASQPVALRVETSALRTRLLSQLSTNLPNALFVTARTDLDQVERVVLDLATGLGPGTLEEVDATLRRDPDDLRPTLDVLSNRLDGRSIVVDDWDALTRPLHGDDLRRAVGERAASLTSWLGAHARIFLGTERRPELVDWMSGVAELERTLELGNGRTPPWSVSRRRTDLALTAFALGDQEALNEPRSVDEQRRAIEDLLGRDAQHVMAATAIHGRPLPRPLAVEIGGGQPRAIETLIRVRLCHEVTGAGLIADRDWTVWFERDWALAERNRIHQRLATAFTQLAAPEQLGLDVLEAHRHFVAAGMLADARRFIRYGVIQLVDAARQRSRQSAWADAAQIYQDVLTSSEAMQWPLGRRLRGYVRHYLHFNRARAQIEDLDATAEGYGEALADWPENALFWSRLARAEFYRGNGQRGMAALQRAQNQVADHPLKATVLIARTVRGLLEQSKSSEQQHLVSAAVRVWGDYVPDTDLAAPVLGLLHSRIALGWLVAQLDCEAPVHFTRPVLLRIQSRANGTWQAELPDLDTQARGRSPQRALEALNGALRTEVDALRRAFTHQLDGSTRFRKRILLGAVDLIASQLDARASKSTWVMGDIERRADGSMWLHTGGGFDLWFEIPADLAAGCTPSDGPHFARVDAGPSGEPRGPVFELEPALRGSPADLSERLRRWRVPGVE
ncbi:MAG: hypothetical protein IPK74_32825 [Deltaproteobacteria bacterium]|nr:hypothetical protein [Deltaproteobacteria bacterium]